MNFLVPFFVLWSFVGFSDNSDCTLTAPKDSTPAFKEKLKSYKLQLEPNENSATETGILGKDVDVKFTRNACIHFGRQFQFLFPNEKDDGDNRQLWLKKTSLALAALQVQDLASFLAKKVKEGVEPKEFEGTGSELEQVMKYEVEKVGPKTRVIFQVYLAL